jgi:hypothetical protein
VTEHLKKHSTPYFCVLLAIQIEKDYQTGVQKDQLARLWRKQTANAKPAQSLNEAEAIHQALHPSTPTSQVVITNNVEKENDKNAVNVAPKELQPQKFAGVGHFPLKEVSAEPSLSLNPDVSSLAPKPASKAPAKSTPPKTFPKTQQTQRPIAGISMDQRKLASRLLKINSESPDAASALAK